MYKLYETWSMNCIDMRYRNGMEYEVWTVSNEWRMKSMKCELVCTCMCVTLWAYMVILFHSLSVVSHHNSVRVLYRGFIAWHRTQARRLICSKTLLLHTKSCIWIRICILNLYWCLYLSLKFWKAIMVECIIKHGACRS